MYNTVIFDLDGTLLNTLEDLTDSVNYTMQKHGLAPKTNEQVRCYVGNGIRKLIERCIPEGAKNPDYETIFETFRSYYTDHCRIKTQPYAGIPELLKTLSGQGIKLAIVSNKNDTAVEELNEIFFKEYISVAIGQNDQIRPKPAPDTVDMALKRLGSRREESLYVGDSDVDKATADNSGMDCVSVTWGFRDRALLESLKPMAIIDRPEELTAYVIRSQSQN